MPATITDPRVRFAILKRCERQARNEAREAVRAALLSGSATLRELMERTGLERWQCGRAVDELKVNGTVTEEPEGVFGLDRQQ
ncbi:MAG TPA: hypothetical protein VN736_29455 [Candidatus Limnocylindrales bacterium]|nr:hypothetical protein [Candidatus Limnocylindrales bacterium]